MGIFDRLRKRPSEDDGPRPNPGHLNVRPPASDEPVTVLAAQPGHGDVPIPEESYSPENQWRFVAEPKADTTLFGGPSGAPDMSAYWVTGDEQVRVHGLTIRDAMVYVSPPPGRSDEASPGSRLSPSLIDTALPIDKHTPAEGSLGYWPSYSGLTKACRWAYLRWLSEGRDGNANIGYVFVFFYGLEWRALIDLPRGSRSQLERELPLIRAEVARLLTMYRQQMSFERYASSLIEAIDALLDPTSERAAPPPVGHPYYWDMPLSMRLRLGDLAARRAPVPAAWAYSWCWYNASVPHRTPWKRCPEEFEDLFFTRYRTIYGDGFIIIIGVNARPLRPVYHWATQAMIPETLPIATADVVDVASSPDAIWPLPRLIGSVTDELDAYSRHLARAGSERGDVGAVALLPLDVPLTKAGDLTQGAAQLRDIALAAAESGATLSGAQVLACWSGKSPDRLTKTESVILAQFFARFGIAMEPDVRLGGPSLTATTPLVLFHRGPEDPSAASAEYTATATLMHLAAAVAAADGTTDPVEHQPMFDHLERNLALTPSERLRLAAHLRWLGAAPVKLTGLAKRIAELDEARRVEFADLLLVVAAADGSVAPSEIALLQRIYKILDLDDSPIHARLHQLLTLPAHRPGAPPGPPAAARAEPARASSEATGFELDMEAIRAKIAETASVSEVLAEIFAEEDEAVSAAPPPHETPGTPAPASTQVVLVGDLDARHSAFLADLAARHRWSRDDLTALASQHALLIDGAVDVLNEAAIDLTGEVLLEDEGDDFTIDPDTLKEFTS